MDINYNTITTIFPDFPKCKLNQYLNLKKKSYNYATIESNNQINTINTITKSNKRLLSYHYRLLILLEKFNLAFIPNKTDSFYYNQIKERNLKKKSSNKKSSNKKNDFICNQNLHRAQFYSYLLKLHTTSAGTSGVGKNSKYLDYGCGDCKITSLLGKELGLSPKSIFGVDLPAWGPYADKSNKNFDFNYKTLGSTDKFSFKDNTFDLVSCFMVLHHIDDITLSFRLKELHRIIKKNKYLIIREHDASNNIDAMLIDIEHRLYPDYDAMPSYFGKYYDWIEWTIILHNHGFKLLFMTYDFINLPYEITPTKSFIAIFSKL
jgi:SAM-dependent methyltransferase